MVTIVPDSPCPYCHTVNDASTHSLGKAKPPRPHDMALCMNCGGWMVFNEDLTTREPSPDERVEIEASPRCAAAFRVWLAAAKYRKDRA
jgi:hypothetical protein